MPLEKGRAPKAAHCMRRAPVLSRTAPALLRWAQVDKRKVFSIHSLALGFMISAGDCLHYISVASTFATHCRFEQDKHREKLFLARRLPEWHPQMAGVRLKPDSFSVVQGYPPFGAQRKPSSLVCAGLEVLSPAPIEVEPVMVGPFLVPVQCTIYPSVCAPR